MIEIGPELASTLQSLAGFVVLAIIMWALLRN